MTHEKASVPQYAVWFFIAATFVFAAPTIIFQGEPSLWLSVLTMLGGLALVVLGGIQLGREISARRRQADSPPES